MVLVYLENRIVQTTSASKFYKTDVFQHVLMFWAGNAILRKMILH
jgi:hypothetical protein